MTGEWRCTCLVSLILLQKSKEGGRWYFFTANQYCRRFCAWRVNTGVCIFSKIKTCRHLCVVSCFVIDNWQSLLFTIVTKPSGYRLSPCPSLLAAIEHCYPVAAVVGWLSLVMFSLTQVCSLKCQIVNLLLRQTESAVWSLFSTRDFECQEWCL